MNLRTHSTPRSAVSKSIAIDIGSQFVKMIVLGGTGTGAVVLNVLSIPFDERLVREGVVTDAAAMGELIRSALLTRNIDARFASFNVPPSVAHIHLLDLPPLDQDSARAAARLKLRKSDSVNVQDCFVGVASPRHARNHGAQLAASPATLGTEVVTVPQAVLRTRAEAIVHAGLEPVAAELEVHSILRVVERQLSEQGSLWRNASVTIIDIGSVTTQIYVVQNGTIQLSRTLRFGTRTIVASIVEKAELTREQAEDVLADPNTFLDSSGIFVRGRSGETLRGTVAVPFAGLVREFQRLIKYFISLHPERSYAGILERAILCGSVAGIAGVAPYLSNQLRMKLLVASPFQGVLTQIDAQSFSELVNQESAYTVAMGLAMGHEGETERLGNNHRIAGAPIEVKRVA